MCLRGSKRGVAVKGRGYSIGPFDHWQKGKEWKGSEGMKGGNAFFLKWAKMGGKGVAVKWGDAEEKPPPDAHFECRKVGNGKGNGGQERPLFRAKGEHCEGKGGGNGGGWNGSFVRFNDQLTVNWAQMNCRHLNGFEGGWSASRIILKMGWKWAKIQPIWKDFMRVKSIIKMNKNGMKVIKISKISQNVWSQNNKREWEYNGLVDWPSHSQISHSWASNHRIVHCTNTHIHRREHIQNERKEWMRMKWMGEMGLGQLEWTFSRSNGFVGGRRRPNDRWMSDQKW
jgi:hypothetical protein